MKQSTFNLFILKTTSAEFIHFLLILIEYIFFIFPSSVDAAMKINHFKLSKEEYQSQTAQVNVMILFKYFESYLLCVSIVGIVSVLLVFYALIYFLGTSEHKAFQFLEHIIANVYDLIIFRYFSIIPLNSSLMLFSLQIAKEMPSSAVVNAVICLLFFCVFSVANYFFITQCCVFMNISNPKLVSKPRKYPFDRLSKEYDMMLFILKIFISIEYNYFRYTNRIGEIVIAMNAIIILIGFVLFFWFFLMNSIVFWNNAHSYANTKHNAIRKGVALFNFTFICFGVIFLQAEVTTINIVVLSLMLLNITLIVLFFANHVSKQYHSAKQELSCDFILFLLIADHKDANVLLQLKIMLDSLMRKHRKKSQFCGIKTCFLCLNFSNVNEKIIDNIAVLYKYLKQKKPESSFHSEVVKLFYYEINKKKLKYYRYYYYLINKYKASKPAYIRNLRLISQVWFSKGNESNSELISFLLEVNIIERKMVTLLGEMHSFITQTIEVKNPESLIELSSSLNDCTVHLKAFLEKSNLSMNLFSQLDPILKNINGAFNYHINLLRYILENLINQPLSNLLPLNIESLEDFLSLHFASDQTLICSVDLSSMLNQEIEIIKITGSLITHDNPIKLLSDYFPKEIQREGIDLFNHQINSANSSDLSDSRSFSFPFITKGFIEYVKYTFFISTIPKSSSILIIGQFMKLRQKSVLLNFNNPKVVLLGFCKDFMRLMRLKRQWLVLLKEVNMVYYLKYIFKTIKRSEDEKKLECEFNFKHYLQFYSNVIKELKVLAAFKAKDNNDILINESFDKMKRYANDSITVTLEKVCEYSQGIRLFDMKIQSKCRTSAIGKQKENYDDVTQDEEKLENLFYNINSTTYSASSLSKNGSISSYTQSKSTHNSEYQVLNTELQTKISREAKKLSWFTLILLGLNSVLIIICIVFLFTQISQTTQLSALSTMYFHFKNIRWVIANIFMSLVTTVCYSSSLNETENCVNGYKEYTVMFQTNFSMPPEFDLLKYAMTELTCKAEFGQNSLNSFKSLIFSSSNANFQGLLNNKMKYYEFKEDINTNYLISFNITFEEGLRKYINSILVLTQTDGEYNALYDSLPFYFIQYSQGTYLFDASIAKKLNPTQMEIYKGITNYNNFVYSFSKGDIEILNQFNSLGQSNNVMNIIFMVTIVLFNVVLCVLCKKNIDTAYYIFKVLIFNLIFESENKETAARITTKVDNLILLGRYYKKNPNHIIKAMTKEKVKTKGWKSTPTNYREDSDEGNSKDKPLKVSFGHSFYDYLVGKMVVFLVFCFGAFFAIIIVFDVVLIFQFQEVLNLFDYTLVVYNNDHNSMTNIAMSTMSYIGNISNEDVAVLMGDQVDTDGEIINKRISQNLHLNNQLLLYSSQNSTKYPTLEQHVVYSCEGLFFSMNETFIMKVSQILKADYRIACQFICRSFDVLHVPNFNYIRTDIIYRTFEVLNKRSGGDYATLYAYSSDKQLYTLYMLVIMIFCPISKNFKDTVLVPKLKSSFSFYVVLVGVYLAVNIILEVVLFIAVRLRISNALSRIQKNLYLLNNCIS